MGMEFPATPTEEHQEQNPNPGMGMEFPAPSTEEHQTSDQNPNPVIAMEFPAPPTEEHQTIPHQDLPSILLVGPPNAGKGTILKRLLAMGNSKSLPTSNLEEACHDWTIDTKYYTADVHIWTACLSDNEGYANAEASSLSDRCEALVLVFDLSHFSSFELLQEWAGKLELQKFEILLCVGNKADRVPGHFGHSEYRKRLQKVGESSSDPHPEFWDYGIQQSDGSSLLGSNEEFIDERRRSCMEWCMEHGIEYIEACAIDEIFDKCMSIDGDSQGLNRIWGALSAHMWPGMVMKSERKLSDTMPLSDVEDDGSDADSEIHIEYELLSNGSAEPWDGDEGPWTFYENFSGDSTEVDGIQEASIVRNVSLEQHQRRAPSQQRNGSFNPATPHGMTTVSADSSLSVDVTSSHGVSESMLSPGVVGNCQSGNSEPGVVGNGQSDNNESVEAISGQENIIANVQRQEGTNHENGARQQEVDSYNDLEQLMHEMARMRENSRLMPDSHRREMAARLAMQMASMFDEED